MDRRGTDFEWDENKRLSNIQKHGIDFVRALDAFWDPQSFEYRSRADHEEQRCVLVGKADGRLLAVIYVTRGLRIRIISARLARREERKLWNENTS